MSYLFEKVNFLVFGIKNVNLPTLAAYGASMSVSQHLNLCARAHGHVPNDFHPI